MSLFLSTHGPMLVESIKIALKNTTSPSLTQLSKTFVIKTRIFWSLVITIHIREKWDADIDSILRQNSNGMDKVDPNCCTQLFAKNSYCCTFVFRIDWIYFCRTGSGNSGEDFKLFMGRHVPKILIKILTKKVSVRI